MILAIFIIIWIHDRLIILALFIEFLKVTCVLIYINIFFNKSKDNLLFI